MPRLYQQLRAPAGQTDLIFITETKAQKVTRINSKTGEVASVDLGITKPNGITLTQDGGTLAVSDYGGAKPEA